MSRILNDNIILLKAPSKLGEPRKSYYLKNCRLQIASPFYYMEQERIQNTYMGGATLFLDLNNTEVYEIQKIDYDTTNTHITLGKKVKFAWSIPEINNKDNLILAIADEIHWYGPGSSINKQLTPKPLYQAYIKGFSTYPYQNSSTSDHFEVKLA